LRRTSAAGPGKNLGRQPCPSLCESFRVATLALVFTWMRLQVIKEGAESVDGLSLVERGFERWRPAVQLGVRTLAQIGFCSAANIRRGCAPTSGPRSSARAEL